MAKEKGKEWQHEREMNGERKENLMEKGEENEYQKESEINGKRKGK